MKFLKTQDLRFNKKFIFLQKNNSFVLTLSSLCYIKTFEKERLSRIMSIIRSVMIKLGLANLSAERSPISVFLLDDDRRRHRWFQKRFEGDDLDIAETVDEAKEFLQQYTYDAIFLDHDLLPHHYESNTHSDFENTGYEIARWLNENKELQRAATIVVHTRNADAAIGMVETLRESGRTVEYCAFPMLDLKIKNYWKR